MAIKKDGVGNDRLTFRAQAFLPGGCDCDTPGYEDEVGNDNVVDVSCSDSVKVLRTLPMELTDEERDMVKGYLKISDITRAYIAANGHLFIVMNDGTERDVGDARGIPGDTPEFGDNGNWFIGGKDTGVPTTGPQGPAPYIGENGNWWIEGRDLGIRTGKPKLGDIMESLQHPGAGWVACDDGIEAPGTPLYEALPYNTEWRKVPTEKAGLPQATAFKPLPVAGQWYYMKKYTGTGSYGEEAFVYDANTDTIVTFSCPSVSSAEKSYGMTGLTHDGDRYVLCVSEMQISASMTGVTHFFASTNLEDWDYQASFNARGSGYFATDLCFDGTYLLVIEHYGYGEQQEYAVRFDKALSTRTEISGIGTESHDFIALPFGYWSYATTDDKHVTVRGSGSITSKFTFSSSYNLGRVAFFNDRYWFGLPVEGTTSTHIEVVDLTTNTDKTLSVTTLTGGVADHLYGAEYDPNTNEWTLYTEYGVGSRHCAITISADADPTKSSSYKATPTAATPSTLSYEQMKPDRSQMRLSSDSYRMLRDPNLKYRPKSGDNPHYIYAGVGGEAIVAPSMYAVDADAVHYYSDDVTDAQRTRARENIGAASVTELNALRDDVDQRIANVPKFSTLVVESLPVRDISDTTVYLVPTGDGEDLYTEYINVNGKWEKLGTQTVLSVPGEKGDDGITPHIGENGNWWLGEVDTGVAAKGDDGITPHIGANGNWYIGDTDTGVLARGLLDLPSIGANGNWFIGGVDTGVAASGGGGVTEITSDMVVDALGYTPVTPQQLQSVSQTATAAQTAAANAQTTASGAVTAADEAKIQIVTTGGTSTAYTATVPGITSLTAGVNFIMLPHTSPMSTSVTLDVNNLGAKNLKRATSNGGVADGSGMSWLSVGKPLFVIYNGTYWVIQNMLQPVAVDLSGTLAIGKGGTSQTGFADTKYTSVRYRGTALYNTDTDPTTNGVINWTYK